MEISWGVPAKDENEYWERMNTIRHSATSQASVTEIFDERAACYDKEVQSFAKYDGPDVIGSAIEELVDDKNAKILDAAAGTGLVGGVLYQKGYFNLDAVDASSKMLEEARNKNIYNNIMCEYVGPNTLPIDNDVYDVVAIGGALMPNQVQPDCFPQIIRIIKKGGHFMSYNRYGFGPDDQAYYTGFTDACDSLETDGRWRQIKREETSHFPKKNCFSVLFISQIL